MASLVFRTRTFAIALFVLFLCLLVSGEYYSVSKQECQTKTVESCRNAGCRCKLDHYKLFEQELEKEIAWSEFTITCDQVEKVRNFVGQRPCSSFDIEKGTEASRTAKNSEDSLAVEVSEMIDQMKNEEYTKEEKQKAFTVFRLEIHDNDVKSILPNCTDNAETKCLSKTRSYPESEF